MKQLSRPPALRPLLLAYALYAAALPASAANPPRAPAPSLTSVIFHPDAGPDPAMCLNGEASPTLLSRVTTALTVASLRQAEPGFVLIDDMDALLGPAKAAPGAELASLAIRLAEPEPATADTAPDKASEKPGKLAQLAVLPREWAEKAKALSAHIAEKFKVDEPHADKVIRAAFKAGQQTGLSPNLVLAVIAVESSFKPSARNGNARGLMQIIPFWHKTKVNQVGGPNELMKSDKNIAVGSAILKEYLDRSENVFQALTRYNASPHAHAYSEKVLKQKKGFDAIFAPAAK
jgi:soluble lytic murein transglycosylase-like protein